MRAWTYTIPRGLTPAECQMITAHTLRHVPEQEGLIGHGGKSAKDEGIRKSLIRWISRDLPEYQQLFSKVDIWMSRANAMAFDMRVDGLPYECQFSTYSADQAMHYDWHEDNAWLSPGSDRKLSMVIQLSDTATYGGGNLELARDTPGPDKFGNQGDVLIFPSFLRHKVHPVTFGIRYSLAVWWRGPCLS